MKARFTPSKRKEIKNALGMRRCRYCLSEENLTIDHKIPLIKGGKDDITNLQCLCRRCNGMKSGMTHGQVRSLFRWFWAVNEGRIAGGKKPYGEGGK